MSNKSIIIISNTFFPAETGGPDNSTFWLSKILSKKYKVTVLSTSKGLNQKNIKINKIVLNHENKINNNLLVFYYTSSFRLFKNFSSLLFKDKTRIVILNSIFLKKNFFLFF